MQNINPQQNPVKTTNEEQCRIYTPPKICVHPTFVGRGVSNTNTNSQNTPLSPPTSECSPSQCNIAITSYQSPEIRYYTNPVFKHLFLHKTEFIFQLTYTLDNKVHRIYMENVGDKRFAIFSVKLKILVIDCLRVIISTSSVTVIMDQKYKVWEEYLQIKNKTQKTRSPPPYWNMTRTQAKQDQGSNSIWQFRWGGASEIKF